MEAWGQYVETLQPMKTTGKSNVTSIKKTVGK
jgi:hypothetical protein